MRHKIYFYVLIFMFVLFTFFFNFSLVKGRGNLPQQNPSPTIVPSITNAPSTVPTVTIQTTAINVSSTEPPCCSTKDQTIDLYKQALDVSQNTVDNVHATANLVIAVVGFVFTGIGLAIAGGTWLVGNTIKNSTTQFEQAREQLATVQIKYEQSVEEFDSRNSAAKLIADELVKKQSDLHVQLTTAEKMLQSLQSEMIQLKSLGEMDRRVLKKPLTLVQIDEYGMQLLSGTTLEKESAISVLIELSTRSDAVVRRKAIEALGMSEIYNERIVKRLKEVIKSDSAQGVRQEAKKSLKLIEAKKPKKAKKTLKTVESKKSLKSVKAEKPKATRQKS